MTRDEIIGMVREIAGSDLENATVAGKVLDEIVPMCMAVAAWNGWQAGAAAERERCARVCESVAHNSLMQKKQTWSVAANGCAAAIRGMK